MMWLAQQMTLWLGLAFALGFVTSLALTVRRVTVQRWVEVPPEPVTVPAEPEAVEGESSGVDDEPTQVSEPASPFPTLEGANDPAPWEQEELWSRPAATTAAASTAGTVRARESAQPADEWDEAATNWRTWADEAAGRAQAEQDTSDRSTVDPDEAWGGDDEGFASGVARGGALPSDDELFARDREMTPPRTPLPSDDELFARDREEAPLEETHEATNDDEPARWDAVADATDGPSPFPSPVDAWPTGGATPAVGDRSTPWDSVPEPPGEASPFPSPVDTEPSGATARDDDPVPGVFPTLATDATHDGGTDPAIDDAPRIPGADDVHGEESVEVSDAPGFATVEPHSDDVAGDDAGEVMDDPARLNSYAAWREAWRASVPPTASVTADHEPPGTEEPATEVAPARPVDDHEPPVTEQPAPEVALAPGDDAQVPMTSDTDMPSGSDDVRAQGAGGVAGSVQPFRRKRRSELLRERKESEGAPQGLMSRAAAWARPPEVPPTSATPTGVADEAHDDEVVDAAAEQAEESAAPWADGPAEHRSLDDLQSEVDDLVEELEDLEETGAVPDGTQTWGREEAHAEHGDGEPAALGTNSAEPESEPEPMAEDEPEPMAEDEPEPMAEDEPEPMAEDEPVLVADDETRVVEEDHQHRWPLADATSVDAAPGAFAGTEAVTEPDPRLEPQVSVSDPDVQVVAPEPVTEVRSVADPTDADDELGTFEPEVESVVEPEGPPQAPEGASALLGESPGATAGVHPDVETSESAPSADLTESGTDPDVDPWATPQVADESSGPEQEADLSADDQGAAEPAEAEGEAEPAGPGFEAEPVQPEPSSELGDAWSPPEDDRNADEPVVATGSTPDDAYPGPESDDDPGRGGMWARSMRRMRRGDKVHVRDRGGRRAHGSTEAPSLVTGAAHERGIEPTTPATDPELSSAADEPEDTAQAQDEVVTESTSPTPEPTVDVPLGDEVEADLDVDQVVASSHESVGWADATGQVDPAGSSHSEVLEPDVEAASDAVVESPPRELEEETSLGWVEADEADTGESSRSEVLEPDVEAARDAVVEPLHDAADVVVEPPGVETEVVAGASTGWPDTTGEADPAEPAEPGPVIDLDTGPDEDPLASTDDLVAAEEPEGWIDDTGSAVEADAGPGGATHVDEDEDEDEDEDVEAGTAAEPDEAEDLAGLDFSNGVPRPYGPGSAYAPADGTIPLGYAIKGQNSTMLFYPRTARFYTRVSADVYFDTEESAERAGFVRFDRRSSTAHVSLRPENLR